MLENLVQVKPVTLKSSFGGAKKLKQINEADALRQHLVRAESLRRDGKLGEAEKICRQLLGKHPTYLGALQTFGLISLEKKNFPQAVTCFLTASAEAPEDSSNFLNLAAAWIGLERHATARLMLERALSLNPNVSEVHHLLGDVETKERNYETARHCFEQAVKLDPGNVLSLFKLADTLVTLGSFDQAKAVLKKLRKKRHDWVAVTSLYTLLPDQVLDVDLEEMLEKARRQPIETQEDFESNKEFVQASILHRSGKYEQAWHILSSANAKIFASHPKEVEKARNNRANQLASAHVTLANELRTSKGKITPLFVLGPSRSGKTTLENLISSDDAVYPGFENSNVEQSTRRACQVSGIYTIENLWGLPAQLQPEFAKDFRRRIAIQAGDAAVITNTSPGLIGSAAQIAASLPEARFVFIDRNEHDLALRIFMKKYKRGNFYSYDVDEIRQYIAWYRELFDLLDEKLGQRSVRLSYEDMISDAAAARRQVLELCGLPFDSSETRIEIGDDRGCADPYREWL